MHKFATKARYLRSFGPFPVDVVAKANSARLPFTMRRFDSVVLAPGYVEDLSKGKMLRYEASLPKLPVPSLEETGKRYLKSVHPLLPEQQYKATVDAVTTFVKPGGEGEPLQQRLLDRAAHSNTDNWLYEWWNDSAYLGCRDPVVPYVSYFYSHIDDKTRRDPSRRATAMTTAALEFKKQVDDGSLEPEYLRKEPMAMSSYHYMFNSCRIPAKPADYTRKYPSSGHEYIVAIRKNRFYKVQTHVNGQQLNTTELQKAFEQVYALTPESVPAVGSLTSQNRDVWTNSRQALITASPANAEALETIEAASFIVCLDNSSPVTCDERARQYWHGDGRNRWFDKPLQFVINDNGTSGFIGEHSMMDGTPTHRLNDYANAQIFGNKLNFSDPNVRPGLPSPEPIDFALDDSLLEDIATAKAHFDGQVAAHEVKVQVFQAYGKGLIKKFKCSPDAYVQMLIQLAYYKMYGVNRPTYESATTRKFCLGRTEATRTVSDESVAWCRAMANSNAPSEELIRLFREAIAAHVKYTAAASLGYGVDRHLFGLKKSLLPDEPLPQIYKDPAYAYSSRWYLSTSQLSSEYFNGYGWSQVVDDGFGIAYMIKDSSLQMNIVCKKLGAERMSYYLNEAGLEMRDLLMTELVKEPAKAKL